MVKCQYISLCCCITAELSYQNLRLLFNTFVYIHCVYIYIYFWYFKTFVRSRSNLCRMWLLLLFYSSSGFIERRRLSQSHISMLFNSATCTLQTVHLGLCCRHTRLTVCDFSSCYVPIRNVAVVYLPPSISELHECSSSEMKLTKTT